MPTSLSAASGSGDKPWRSDPLSRRRSLAGSTSAQPPTSLRPTASATIAEESSVSPALTPPRLSTTVKKQQGSHQPTRTQSISAIPVSPSGKSVFLKIRETDFKVPGAPASKSIPPLSGSRSSAFALPASSGSGRVPKSPSSARGLAASTTATSAASAAPPQTKLQSASSGANRRPRPSMVPSTSNQHFEWKKTGASGSAPSEAQIDTAATSPSLSSPKPPSRPAAALTQKRTEGLSASTSTVTMPRSGFGFRAPLPSSSSIGNTGVRRPSLDPAAQPSNSTPAVSAPGSTTPGKHRRAQSTTSASVSAVPASLRAPLSPARSPQQQQARALANKGKHALTSPGKSPGRSKRSDTAGLNRSPAAGTPPSSRRGPSAATTSSGAVTRRSLGHFSSSSLQISTPSTPRCIAATATARPGMEKKDFGASAGAGPSQSSTSRVDADDQAARAASVAAAIEPGTGGRSSSHNVEEELLNHLKSMASKAGMSLQNLGKMVEKETHEKSHATSPDRLTIAVFPAASAVEEGVVVGHGDENDAGKSERADTMDESTEMERSEVTDASYGQLVPSPPQAQRMVASFGTRAGLPPSAVTAPTSAAVKARRRTSQQLIDATSSSFAELDAAAEAEADDSLLQILAPRRRMDGSASPSSSGMSLSLSQRSSDRSRKRMSLPAFSSGGEGERYDLEAAFERMGLLGQSPGESAVGSETLLSDIMVAGEEDGGERYVPSPLPKALINTGAKQTYPALANEQEQTLLQQQQFQQQLDTYKQSTLSAQQELQALRAEMEALQSVLRESKEAHAAEQQTALEGFDAQREAETQEMLETWEAEREVWQMDLERAKVKEARRVREEMEQAHSSNREEHSAQDGSATEVARAVGEASRQAAAQKQGEVARLAKAELEENVLRADVCLFLKAQLNMWERTLLTA